MKQLLQRLRAWWAKRNHRHDWMKWAETGEEIVLHWEIPWLFHQRFRVCSVCRTVEVLDQSQNGAGILGGYRQERDGKLWSGQCHYGKVPSIGRDQLTVRSLADEKKA